VGGLDWVRAATLAARSVAWSEWRHRTSRPFRGISLRSGAPGPRSRPGVPLASAQVRWGDPFKNVSHRIGVVSDVVR
jgi:hypothetical protein